MKALVVDNICKNFGGLQALNRVRVEVEVGQRQVIIGPNGAGKTTLFDILSGILLPTSGEVYFFEENITRLPIHLRANLQLLQTFQLVNLFKGLTVLENIVLAIQSFKRTKFMLLRRLNGFRPIIHQAEEFLKEWGFGDKRNTRVSNLSHGDQRLLDIMLALASQPRLLLMDEPTEGLAPLLVNNLRDVLQSVKEKALSILLVEQNLSFALELADHIYVMSNGVIPLESSPEEFHKNEEAKHLYLGV